MMGGVVAGRSANEGRGSSAADLFGDVSGDIRCFFYDRDSRPPVPEKVLMVAILEQALRDLLQQQAELDPAPALSTADISRWWREQAEAHDDARAWFLSESTTWMYDFESICDTLELDAAALRAKVMKLHDQSETWSRGVRPRNRQLQVAV